MPGKLSFSSPIEFVHSISTIFPNLRDDLSIERLWNIKKLIEKKFDEAESKGILQEFTLHDERHSEEILRVIRELLPRDVLLNLGKHDAFCLAAAAYFHDIGMVVDVNDPEYVPAREGHNERSSEFVRQLPYVTATGKLEMTECREIANLCLYHASSKRLSEIRGDKRLAWLAAVLSLSDECDTGAERCPTGKFEELKREGKLEYETAKHWIINRMVTHVNPRVGEEKIYLEAEVPGPKDLYSFLIDLKKRKIQQEIDRTKEYLIGVYEGFYGYRLAEIGKVDEVNPTRYDNPIVLTKAGISILADADWPIPSSTYIAKFLANAVIAVCDPQSTITLGNENITDGINTIVRMVMDLRPQLHTLHHIAKLIGKHIEGQSINTAWKASLTSDMKNFMVSLERSIEDVSKNAVRILKSKSIFFLFGYGGPMSRTIERMVGTGKNLYFVISYCRPVGEGRQIYAVNELIRLKKSTNSNLDYEVVPPELIAESLQRTETQAVLMGCEAVEPNGDIINSTGSHMIAAIATDLGIPVYVLTDSYKIEDHISETFHKLPVEKFLRTDVPREVSTSIDRTKRYPCAERIPSEKISGIITEKGMEFPNNIYETYKERQTLLKSGKLVVFDIDDTLMRLNQPIDPVSAQRLKLLRAKGYRIAFSSGKPAVYLAAIARMLNVDDSILIAENGSIIWLISQMPAGTINNAIRKEKLKELELAQLLVEAHFRDRVFFQPNTINLTIFPFTDSGVTPKQLKEFLDNMKLQGVQIIPHIDSVDCLPSGIDKGSALNLIIKRLDLKKDNVIAVGNGLNDLPMFKVAGTSIFVGDNAELGKSATYRVSSIHQAFDLIDRLLVDN